MEIKVSHRVTKKVHTEYCFEISGGKHYTDPTELPNVRLECTVKFMDAKFQSYEVHALDNYYEKTELSDYQEQFPLIYLQILQVLKSKIDELVSQETSASTAASNSVPIPVPTPARIQE